MLNYNTQTDPKWCNDSMGLKEDILKDYGCLVSTIANIYQLAYVIEMTPKELNDYIKENNLYFGKEYIGKESFLKTDELLKKLGLKRKSKLKHSQYEENKNCWFYVRVIFYGYGHYMNVIKKEKDRYLCFNVYNGKYEYWPENKIQELYKIEKVEE